MADHPQMQNTCSDLKKGVLNSANPDHVLEQLRSEGKRRIDAFVFELIFKRRLSIIALSVPDLAMSFGWHIGYNKYGQPAYWFRLMNDEQDWNGCDDVMTDRLTKFRIGPYCADVCIVRVQFLQNSNEYVASDLSVNGWANWMPIDQVLLRLPLKDVESDPRSMLNVDPGSAELAFKWLRHDAFAKELPALSIQRRFMNCILGPALGRDGTDLDALTLYGNKLRCIEFKRKYPAGGKNKFFGIDQFPHVKTIQTLEEMGVSSLHMLLVGPKWDKSESPVDWLNRRELDSAWTWLAADLDSQAFENIALHTKGSDSGQRPGNRTQESIRWDRITLLNEGLKFNTAGAERLVQLLGGGNLTDGAMTYESLFDRRAAE